MPYKNPEDAKAHRKKYYASNKDKIKTYVNSHRANNYFLLRQYLQGKCCVDCGEADPVVLQFDHLSDKAMGISDMINQKKSWEVIRQEINKCEIVCANCHTRRTAKQLNWYKHCDFRGLTVIG